MYAESHTQPASVSAISCTGSIRQCEGASCQQAAKQSRCQSLLQIIRQKAVFALKSTALKNPLGHAREMQVQLGCLSGIRKIIDSATTDKDSLEMCDIDTLLSRVEQHYPDMHNLPIDNIVRSISQTRLRRRRKRHHEH